MSAILDLSPRPDHCGILRAPRSILVGPGQRRATARVVSALGRTVLICTDRRMGQDPALLSLVDEMRGTGLNVTVFEDVEVELPEEGIVGCADRFRHAGIDVIVGIGGGSSLDHAKVLSVLLVHGGRPRDYYGENRVPGPTLPVVALPTTAGTGSEATPVAVLTDADRPVKVGISSPYLIPHTAVVDPELVVSCPPSLTAHSGADALAHCVESFTAIRRPLTADLAHERVFVGSGTVTDTLALAGLRHIGRSLVTAYTNGSDVAARAEMSIAALYGGLALGSGGTSAAHAIQYPLGAITKTPHGLGVGVLLPYVMEYNLPVRVSELTQVAVALGALESAAIAAPTPDAARRGVDAVAELLAAIEIPTTLREIGLAESDLPEVARLAMTALRLVENNPRELNQENCLRIVTAAFHGDRSHAVVAP